MEKNCSIVGYDVVASLGHGAYGEVTLGFDPRTGAAVAIKVVERGGKKGLPVGFSEIVLEGKRR